jgi:hypothetical protein
VPRTVPLDQYRLSGKARNMELFNVISYRFDLGTGSLQLPMPAVGEYIKLQAKHNHSGKGTLNKVFPLLSCLFGHPVFTG